MPVVRDMSAPGRIAAIAATLAVVFLIGFVPQWLRVRTLDRQLVEVRQELALLDLGGRAGAALAESQRGNYERARQLMTGFFSLLQDQVDRAADTAAREEMLAILGQRDEIITLLSRAEPESVSRLNLIYTRYFAATHPLGRQAPASVTPSPPP
jgi:hypothetical protein